MRSPLAALGAGVARGLGQISNLTTAPSKPPVPYTGTYGSGTMWTDLLRGGVNGDPVRQMESFGGVGALFSTVSLHAEALAEAEWHLTRPALGATCGICGEEGHIDVPSHAFLDFLDANQFIGASDLRESVQQHVDLTGEGWLIISMSSLFATVPMELWYARPDRMKPVVTPERFIVGYLYTDPDGHEVPLALSEVERIKLPNPMSITRGLGPVQALLTNLDSIRYSAEWNARFFQNSAIPGGIIEVEKSLTDTEFSKMLRRWRESHKGVTNAHRVAILEQGKWVDRAFSMRDMQFAELQSVSREQVREAFRTHKHMVGIADDVNRANAESAERTFARWNVSPRARRWREAYNRILKRFGPAGAGLDYRPFGIVPEDKQADNEERASKANAYKVLRDAGVHEDDAADVVGLPRMRVEVQPTPEPVPAGRTSSGATGDPTVSDDPAVEPAAVLPALEPPRRAMAAIERAGQPRVRNAVPADMAALQADWLAARAQLVADWQADVLPAQREELARQIEEAASAGDTAGLYALAALTVPAGVAAAILLTAMMGMAAAGAVSIVTEAAAQGVTVSAAMITADRLRPFADAATGLLGSGLARSAGGEALRVYRPDARPASVADQVTEYLEKLSAAELERALGGQLSRAQMIGRLDTLRIAPLATYYASEVLDKNTCENCDEIDGFEYQSLDAALEDYWSGQYLHCLGGLRCRGQLRAVWLEATV